MRKSYNGLQIPAKLSVAKLHLEASKVGITTDTKKQCPCCLKERKEDYGISKDGVHLTKFGSTIPLYFHFSKFLRGYFFIILVGSIYYTYKISKLNYEFQIKKGNNPPITMVLSFLFEEKFLKQKKNEINEINLNSVWIDIATNIVLIIYSFYFKYSQKKMYKEIKNEMKISALDYTVMIGNVHEHDSLSEIKKFLKFELERKGHPMVNIANSNKATFKANLQILKEKAEEKEDEIHEIKEFVKIRKEHMPPEGIKVAEDFIQEKEEEIKEIEAEKLEIIKKDIEMEHNDENCVVFLTLDTVQEKELLLSLKEEKSLFSCWKKRKTKYKILEAPDPSVVKWESIGYPHLERNKSTLFGLLIIILTFPIFGFLIYSFENWKEDLLRSKKNNFIYQNIIGIALMPLVVTVLTAIYIQILEMLRRFNKYIDVNKYFSSSANRLIVIYILTYIISQFVLMKYEKREFVDKNEDFKKRKHVIILKLETYNFFLAEIFIVPISCLFNPEYFIMLFETSKARRAIRWGKPYSSKFHFMTQRELNTIFTKPEIELDFLYSDLTSCFLVIVSACMIVRPLPIFGFCFIFFQNIVDKIQFYNRTKEPPRDSYYLAKRMRNLVATWTPLIFTCVRLYFIYTDNYLRGNISLYQFIIDAALLFFVLVPPASIFELNLKLFLNNMERKRREKANVDVKEVFKSLEMREKKKKEIEEHLERDKEDELMYLFAKRKKYDEVKVFLDCDYERLNPLTKSDAEKKWRDNRVTLSVITDIFSSVSG